MVDLQDLLTKTSRTFALSIPLLPEPTRSEVRLAYLLFRIADTFEDSTVWPKERRIEALASLRSVLDAPTGTDDGTGLAAAWTRQPPVDHDGYVELLTEFPAVLAAFRELDPASRELVRSHTGRTADGMARFVERMDEAGNLRLEDVEDLRAYCYVVAGIVGEMLTELFLLRDELSATAPYLRARARSFGEGLQLVNILKDSASDREEGRTYLPPEVAREEIFELARTDLRRAAAYVQALQDGGAARGVVEFCALPVLLAFATLERVEEEGPGAKITRPEVFSITQAMTTTLDAGEALFPALRGDSDSG